MAGPRPQDVYDPTPSVSPDGGMPNDYVTARANPTAFGADVGAAIQGIGQTGQKVSQEGMDVALKYQGMMNETWATDSETKAATAYAQTLGDYKQLEGLQAANALPGVMTKLAAIRQNIAQDAPNPAAARAFNMLATRREGYALSDASLYSSSQVKDAHTKSAQANLDLSINEMSDPAVAFNPQRSQDAMQNIRFSAATVIDNLGYGKDSGSGAALNKDGTMSFDTTTAAGRQAADVYKEYVDKAVGQAYINRYDTMANDPQHGNVQLAVNDFEKNRDQIPASAQAKISSELSGKYRNAVAASTSDSVFSDWGNKYLTEHDASLKGKYSPQQLLSVFSQQETGGSPEARANNKNQIQPATWAQYAKPGEKLNNPQDNDNVAVRYLTQLYKESNGDPARMAVGYFSGDKNIAPEGSPTMWITDRPDSNGKMVSSYAADIVSKLAKVGNGLPTFQSQSDYFASHYNEILQDVGNRARAASDNPFDWQTATNQAETRMSHMIQQDRVMGDADRNTVIRAFTNPQSGAPVVTDPNQLYGTKDPELKAAWIRWSTENPWGAQTFVQNMAKANAHGAATGYGARFYDLLKGVHDGSITDTGQLGLHVGPSNMADLTNSGFKILQGELAQNSSPDGKAFSSAEQTFIGAVRTKLTGSAWQPGANPTGDAKFNDWLADTLPRIQAMHQQGKTAADLFNEKSKDYVGNNVSQYRQSDADMLKDMHEHSHFLTPGQMFGGQQSTPNVTKRSDRATDLETDYKNGGLDQDRFNQALVREVLDGNITRKQYDEIVTRNKLATVQPQGPQVPRSTDHAD